jgi:hypothetical protein
MVDILLRADIYLWYQPLNTYQQPKEYQPFNVFNNHFNTYKPKENHGYEGNDGPITNYNRIRYPAIPYITGSEGSIISTIGYTAARDYKFVGWYPFDFW